LSNAWSRKNWFCTSIRSANFAPVLLSPLVNSPCQNSVIRSSSGRSVSSIRATHVAITSPGFVVS
jgi:hypothetical protein